MVGSHADQRVFAELVKEKMPKVYAKVSYPCMMDVLLLIWIAVSKFKRRNPVNGYTVVLVLFC